MKCQDDVANTKVPNTMRPSKHQLAFFCLFLPLLPKKKKKEKKVLLPTGVSKSAAHIVQPDPTKRCYTIRQIKIWH
jgi:hypothetical protein